MIENEFRQNEPRYSVARYHSFHLGNAKYLFAPLSLEAVIANEVDLRLLLVVGHMSHHRAILQRAGFDDERGMESFVRLLKRGFIVTTESGELRASLVPASSDVTFMVGVANYCNLTCRYCYVREGAFDFEQPQASHMDNTTADLAIETTFSMNPSFNRYCFHFYGGEPTLNMAIIRRMVERAQEKGRVVGRPVEFAITTNGTLITKEIAEFFNHYRFTVYLSLDGDQKRHDLNRRFRNGRGSFSAVWRGFERLSNLRGIRLFGSAVISPDLPLHQVLTLFADYGIKHAKTERAHVFESDSLSLRGKNLNIYLEDVRRLADHYCKALAEGKPPMDTRLVSKILQMFAGKARTNFCQAGRNVFGISVDGGIYPCALFFGRSDFRLGDVLTGLTGERLERFNRCFGILHQKQCADCWASGLCGGGCPAMVDRFGSDNCTILKAEAETAIAVYARFVEKDPMCLLGVIAPNLADWVSSGHTGS